MTTPRRRPAAIRAAVIAGAPGRLIEVGNRRDAIFGDSAGERDDILLIAGKGHERGRSSGAAVGPVFCHLTM
jgi:UDP-N-acetylmuramoyl-L-alanyl-D-glutamate--2,6-diaminopimelate ligase